MNNKKMYKWQKIVTILLMIFTSFSSLSAAFGSQGQLLIENNLKIFLKKHSSADLKFKETFNNLHHNEILGGICAGLVTVWLYGKWLDTQTYNNNGYNSKWFEKTIRSISKWDSTKKPNNQLSYNFDNFFSLVAFFQDPEFYYLNGDVSNVAPEKSMPLSMLYTNGKSLKKVYSIAATFNRIQLYQLLQKTVHDGELVFILYMAEVQNKDTHMVGLFKQGINFYHYDPQDPHGERSQATLDEVVNFISGISEGLFGKNTSLGISIYSFEQNNHIYPAPHDLLDQMGINVSKTSLLLSSYIGALDSVKFYLDNGVDVNSLNIENSTPLMQAAQCNHIDIAQLLLADPYHAQIDIANNKSNTPLITAAIRGHTKMIKLLIKHGANINHQNILGYTALMMATRFDHIEAVKALVAKGANIDIQNNDLLTALDIAIENNHTQCIQILKERQQHTRLNKHEEEL